MTEHYSCTQYAFFKEVFIDISRGNEFRKSDGSVRILAVGVCFSRVKHGEFEEWFLPYEELTWKTGWGSLEFQVDGKEHTTIWYSSSRAFWDRERNELITTLVQCKDVRYPAVLRRREESRLREEASLRERLASQPSARLVRTARDGEQVAADWLAFLDRSPAQLTPVGADSGVDAFTDRSVAQVKMEAIPTGRSAIQMLFGVATAAKKRPVFFSLAGYTQQAIGWADDVELPLFQFDLQGVPEPVNRAAERLIASA